MVHVEVNSVWLSDALRRQRFVSIGTSGHSPPKQEQAITWADTDTKFNLRWQTFVKFT